jgi:hypothetical protein
MAFVLYERRMAAVEGGDLYMTRMVQQTPSEELRRRDWILATSLADQGYTMEVFRRPPYAAVGTR